MHGPHISHCLAAIALFVGFCATPRAQLALNSGQPLTADSAAIRPSSGLQPGPLVNPPPPMPSFEQVGDAHFGRKQYQAALQAYAKIQQPSTDVWDKMGISYQMMFDLKDALRCYQESLRLDPDNSHTLNNFATVEDSQQDFSAGERFYRKALRFDPRSAMILKNLGSNLLMQHRYRQAQDAYAQALAIDAHIFDEQSGPTMHTPIPVRELGAASYLKARSCARAGLAECAIANLRDAFNQGSATVKKVANENDFESLRGQSEFEGLLAEQK